MSGSLLPSERFEENARAALADPVLHGALARATELFGERRSGALAQVPEWEALRERARVIKAETLAQLDVHLERLEANLVRAGAVVHWARDGQEACRIVEGIARESGARRLVKSKSMTTEEIGLNHALEQAEGQDREPVETDLGEWIIQLAGETPSHIIVPAIHKTKAQIAELFVEKLAVEHTDDAAELTRTARRILREHFAQADLGISGVNFAVAETGTLLVLENEGNARMTTTLPRVHVAMMGIEKVIPRLSDLALFLRLLPRSGTGQHLTSYQSLLTGVKRSPEDEGPEALHVVLLDNGRSAMLKTEVTRQSLACIRCGACLNACPVYREVGGHAYGSVYPGPIGAVITPQLSGLAKAGKLPFASSLCGACRDVCPVKIDLPQLLLHLRSEVVEGGRMPHARDRVERGLEGFIERVTFRLWRHAVSGPRRYRAASYFARFVPHALLTRFGPLGTWSAGREAPRLARRSFRELWKARP